MASDREHSTDINDMLTANSQQRTQYFLEQLKQYNQIWILKDDDGAVMLTAEDEDCIPVWPNQESAELWRNEEWQACEATPISVKDWLARWTNGMQDDELSVAVFPLPGEDGLVVFPDEFERMINAH